MANDINKALNLDTTLENLDKVIKKITVLSDVTDTLSKNTDNLAKAQEDTNKAQEESTKIVNDTKKGVDELTKIERQNLKVKEQLTAADTKANKELQKGKIELQNKNKAIRDSIKAEEAAKKTTDAFNTALNRTAKTINEATADNKALRAAVKDVDGTTEEGRKTIDRYNSIIDKNSKTIHGNSDALVKQKINIGNYGSALSGLPGPLASVGGAIQKLNALLLANPYAAVAAAVVALGSALNSIVNSAAEFQKANAELASVLGVTRKEIDTLQKSSKELGATTAFTSTQVVELQTEYAKLGFSQQQIVDVSKASIDLAIATQAATGDVAAFVGSIINAYGLSAEEASRVADVTAKAASSSALDFEKLSTALPIVSATAKTAGESFEEVTAKLGILSDNAVDASTSATALRNIYLDLAESGLSYEEAMTMINESQDKLTTSLDLFGKRGAGVAIILAENEEKVATLEETLNNAGGTVERVANEQLDTLEGKTLLLGSAWDGLKKTIEDGEGALISIKEGGIVLLTDAINALAGWIETLSASFKNNSEEVENASIAMKALIIAFQVATAPIRAIIKLIEGIVFVVTSAVNKFNELADSSTLVGFVFNKLRSIIESVSSALSKVINLLNFTTDSADRNTEAIEDNTEANEKNEQSQLDQINAQIDAKEAMDSATTSIDENTASLERNAEAAIAAAAKTAKAQADNYAKAFALRKSLGLTTLQEEQQQEADALLASNAFELLTQEEQDEALLALAEKHAEQMLAIQDKLKTGESTLDDATAENKASLLDSNVTGAVRAATSVFGSDKAAASATAGINTAQAVTKALTAGPILGPILAGVIGAAGAVQIAKINGINAFWTGTESAPSGLATVAEKGAELIMPRIGDPYMVTSPSLVNLQGGEKILNARDTTAYMRDDSKLIAAIKGQKQNIIVNLPPSSWTNKYRN